MASFKVGDRVRLVRPKFAENLGCTGIIVAFFAERQSVDYRVNCDVRWDDMCLDRYLSETHTSRLEPILRAPSAQDICEMSAPPDFKIIAPTHMPSDALRAAVLGEGK